MKDAVLIKGNKFGLTIILNDTLDLSVIKQSLYNKLNDSRNFFGQAKVSISFQGRKLTEKEQNNLVEIIQEASDLDIICIVDENHNSQIISKDNTNKPKSIIPEESAIFHKGTLRSGQELIVDSSIIIMGNVHPGAKVSAKGNVIVIGNLNGYVHAGNNGNDQSFIVALKMSPTQLRIGKIIGRAPDKIEDNNNNPKIAYAEDKRIFIEDINRNIYKDLNILNYN